MKVFTDKCGGTDGLTDEHMDDNVITIGLPAFQRGGLTNALIIKKNHTPPSI